MKTYKRNGPMYIWTLIGIAGAVDQKGKGRLLVNGTGTFFSNCYVKIIEIEPLPHTKHKINTGGLKT